MKYLRLSGEWNISCLSLVNNKLASDTMNGLSFAGALWGFASLYLEKMSFSAPEQVQLSMQGYVRIGEAPKGTCERQPIHRIRGQSIVNERQTGDVPLTSDDSSLLGKEGET